MYLPKINEEKDLSVLHALIKAHPFATWVSHSENGLEANHIPFLLNESLGEHGTLIGHVSKSNPIWQTLPAQENALVIFQGAESYISPSWYPSKQEHGKVVPTWNYAVVHVAGKPKPVHDEAWLLECVSALTNAHEASQIQPWKVSDAPSEYIQHMLNGIVGIELPIESIIGKWKVSQNKQEQDQRGVIGGLSIENESMGNKIANYIKQQIEKT